MIYLILFPLIAATLLRVFLPSMEAMDMEFAVDSSVPADIVAALEDCAIVSRYPDIGSLERRVLEFDDVPGITLGQSGFRVILEGNEESYIRELPGAILDYVTDGESLVRADIRTIGTATSFAREYSAIFLVLTCVLIGSVGIGFSVIDDRQSRVVRALVVSPAGTMEYVLAKSRLGLHTCGCPIGRGDFHPGGPIGGGLLETRCRRRGFPWIGCALRLPDRVRRGKPDRSDRGSQDTDSALYRHPGGFNLHPDASNVARVPVSELRGV